MRRFVGAVSLLFAVLFMHGGLGTSCTDSAMGSSSPAMADMATHADSSMALHHLPVTPNQPDQDHKMASCRVILPRADLSYTALLSLTLIAVVSLTVRPHSIRLRPSGREPPRLRYLDPIEGLGVLRT